MICKTILSRNCDTASTFIPEVVTIAAKSFERTSHLAQKINNIFLSVFSSRTIYFQYKFFVM
jgi:hypothetical protein